MKLNRLVLLAIILITSMSSFSKISLKENDKKLVGIWKGAEIDKQIDGVEKHWIVQRFSNGTYVIMFTTKENCEITTFTEKGKWWTKDNSFFEKSEDSESVESYTYEIKEGLVIHFKSTTNEYEFDDYKLE